MKNKKKNINDKIYTKNTNKFCEKIKEHDKDYRLVNISDPNTFSIEISSILWALYDLKNIKASFFATFLNSIYTHRCSVFVTTYRLFSKLVKADDTYTTKSCNGLNYKAMLAWAYDCGYIKAIRNPVSDIDFKKRKAGLYELVDPDLLDPLIKIVGKEEHEKEKQMRIKWFDDNNIPTVEEEEKEETSSEIKKSYDKAEKEKKKMTPMEEHELVKEELRRKVMNGRIFEDDYQ